MTDPLCMCQYVSKTIHYRDHYWDIVQIYTLDSPCVCEWVPWLCGAVPQSVGVPVPLSNGKRLKQLVLQPGSLGFEARPALCALQTRWTANLSRVPPYLCPMTFGRGSSGPLLPRVQDKADMDRRMAKNTRPASLLAPIKDILCMSTSYVISWTLGTIGAMGTMGLDGHVLSIFVICPTHTQFGTLIFSSLLDVAIKGSYAGSKKRNLSKLHLLCLVWFLKCSPDWVNWSTAISKTKKGTFHIISLYERGKADLQLMGVVKYPDWISQPIPTRPISTPLHWPMSWLCGQSKEEPIYFSDSLNLVSHKKYIDEHNVFSRKPESLRLSDASNKIIRLPHSNACNLLIFAQQICPDDTKIRNPAKRLRLTELEIRSGTWLVIRRQSQRLCPLLC